MKQRKFFILFFIIAVMVLAPGVVWAQGGDDPPPAEEPGVAGEVVEPAAVDALVTMAFSGGPAYDSGWVAIRQDQALTLQHHLGGNLDDYVVIMDYKANSINGVNQRYYGGADFGTHPPSGVHVNDRVGAYWRTLTTDAITVYRRPEDIYADFVRIRIWLDPYPNYDSGWVYISHGAAKTLHHNLGGDADDYVVDMQYRSGIGVNQRSFGGMDYGAKAFSGTRNNDRAGVYWRTLTNADITLFRRAEDDVANRVRIRIWKRRATYDSGWVNINPNQAITLHHYISGDPDNYVVDMQYRSTGSGINRRYYGGMDVGLQHASGLHENDRVGAYWRSLTANSITVYRRPEDIYADQVRIRIWHYWQPTAPDYDSRWFPLNAGGPPVTFGHYLGGSADSYLVDMTYKTDDVNGVNQRYYGGADFGTHPAPGHATNDRVSVYWRTLTNARVTLFRRGEDTYAPKARVRIWKAPKPDYNSGWVAISPNQAKTFNHNLYGSVYDYFVDLQYRNTGGVNQRYYGGMDVGSHPAGGLHENDRVGAYWRSLSNISIVVYRRPEDIYAQEVRVRIWRMARPSYDSHWSVINQNQSQTLFHRLHGDPDNYLLQMWQYDTTYNYINQRHYGGADFGTHPPSGYSANDRAGAYWRSLSPNSVIIYRRPEDGFADRVRVRIWDYNQRQFLPIVRK